MKNKKNKKKVISIVALVASFVLCIGATFGITMAYFGGNAKKDLGTLTLKTGITVNAAISTTQTIENSLVVPGQPIDINATGTVKSYNGTTNVVDGILRAKITITATGFTGVTPTINAGTNTGTAAGVWVASGEYYYLCTAAGAKTLQKVQYDETAILTGTADIPNTIKNDMSGKTITASVTFEVVQAELFNGDTKLTDANLTYDNETVLAAFTAVAGY